MELLAVGPVFIHQMSLVKGELSQVRSYHSGFMIAEKSATVHYLSHCRRWFLLVVSVAQVVFINESSRMMSVSNEDE